MKGLGWHRRRSRARWSDTAALRAAATPKAGIRPCPWHRRTRDAVGYSLRLRLMLVFTVLALAMTIIFLGGVQKAIAMGWREAARPLLMDYVDRLVEEVGTPPDIERARAIVNRLPIHMHIAGPKVNWDSHPEQPRPEWMSHAVRSDKRWLAEVDGQKLLQRVTEDGHTIVFGLNAMTWEQKPRIAWFTLTALLLLTAFAYAWVRRLLSPLEDIRQGARRFGAGDFSQPIALPPTRRPDELHQLAATINTMGEDIHQMLEAKRALLLAMSHELRSPLTRARLHTELLPESADTQPQRDALLRDLGEMARLISDLLESERLAGRHAALHREPVDLLSLAREVVEELSARHSHAHHVAVRTDGPADQMPLLPLDRSRMRLLLRNLLDNSLRHTDPALPPVELHCTWDAAGAVVVRVRDYGPGVDPEHLSRLAEPFFRPDTARQRATGGVGLGLYLCRLVAQAHGGSLHFSNAAPGLLVRVVLPPASSTSPA
ncbi:HAMP domain-containing histidine kinase [Acidovorax sp. DW039]|uniref:sensor histidine kinase n=1 Tax=Acidovorax sp. DW039 TaxID=3095606 RepID=UPI00308E595C|nr:HAMP domain-containing histidine kinase [Acidovorax sp. DW039]